MTFTDIKRQMLFASIVPLLCLALTAVSVQAQTSKLSEFTKRVLAHVLLQELGHALFREFGVPVLGNEETTADNFAINYLSIYHYDDAEQVLVARARSWMVEHQQWPPRHSDYRAEHDLDIRRAFNTLCLLYGADPAARRSIKKQYRIPDYQASECSDISPQQMISWEKTLGPLLRKNGPSTNVKVIVGDGPLKQVMVNSGVLETVKVIAERFDWPHPIIIHFDHCGGKSSWSRSQRKILLCDRYVQRFIDQSKIQRKLKLDQ